jgi:hypothetical protein
VVQALSDAGFFESEAELLDPESELERFDSPDFESPDFESPDLFSPEPEPDPPELEESELFVSLDDDESLPDPFDSLPFEPDRFEELRLSVL